MTDTQPRRRAITPPVASTENPGIVAYAIDDAIQVPIVAGTQHRPMLDEPGPTFAVRCLPMLIGSQAGWLLLNTASVTLTWNGGDATSDIEIQTNSDQPHPLLSPHEDGGGLVVWRSGYVFRTNGGWDIVARAPANWPRRGVYGFDKRFATGDDPSIESTRLYELTCIWKLTEPNTPIEIDRDEPFGMIVPYARNEHCQHPILQRPIADEVSTGTAYFAWNRSRAHFKTEMINPVSACRRESWQKDYFRGRMFAGGTFPEHQTKLRLREFDGCPVSNPNTRKG